MEKAKSRSELVKEIERMDERDQKLEAYALKILFELFEEEENRKEKEKNFLQ
jgi:hypothetical protein